MFEDAEVPLYSALIKKISKQDWAKSDLEKRETLVNAVNVISPFAMIDLLEEDIDVMIHHYEDPQRATAVPDTEVRTARENVLAQKNVSYK